MPTDQNPAMSPVEAALAALAPARAALDRDRIMFAAGRTSARASRGPRVPWAAVAAVLAIVSAVEGALLAHRPAPEVVYRRVVEPEAAPTPPPVFASTRVDLDLGLGLGPTAHGRLAGQLARYGLDGLSIPSALPPEGPGRRPIGSRQMLLEELDEPKTGDPS